MNPLLTLEHVSFAYHQAEGETRALSDISFTLQPGHFLAVVGPSGCGKSTLLGALAGLETLDGGTVELYGRPASGADGRMGFMPQRDQLFEWRSIYDNVMLGLQIRNDRDPAHRRNVEGLLKRYGLWEFAAKRPDQLSGGMRQRCALIRTLATQPDILLLDEPFSELDYQTRLAVSGDIWHIIRSEGKTALLVTHDISEAVSMSDRVVVLSRRPATVKAVFDMGELRRMDPLKRRENPAFARYFDAIWKELELRE